MNTKAIKSNQKNNQSVTNELSSKHNGSASTFQFLDNRSETLVQRKLQIMANESLQKKPVVPLETKSDFTGKPMQMKDNEENVLLQSKFAVRAENTTHSGVIQRNGEGKAVVTDLTDPAWLPPGKHKTNAGKAAITGANLKILLRGAAIAAWKTYAYHATKSANVQGITSAGLDPNRGGTGAAAGNAHFEDQSKGKIHYTRNRNLAEDYQRHFEGATPFGIKDPNPASAEVLKIAIPRDVADNEEIDPDSRTSDRAYRTSDAIPGKNIRSTKPKALPPERVQKRGKRKNQPLKPGANAEAWKDHVIRSFADTGALVSNMPSSATNILYDMKQNGMDIMTVCQLIKQALQSMPTSDILELTPEDRKANPRVFQGAHIDATGESLPNIF
jgi:hypothetical protein